MLNGDITDMENVWIVKKNADFTEGRGPMRVHLIFSNFDGAHKWVMAQSGIYGTPQRQERTSGNGHWYYNGYSISKYRVYDSQSSLIDAANRRKEIENEIKDLKEELEAIGNV